MAKCPKCDRLITGVNGQEVNSNFPGASWRTIVFTCPSCSAVLGTQIDPIAIKADIIEVLRKEIRRQ